jgi:hypothetical protein
VTEDYVIIPQLDDDFEFGRGITIEPDASIERSVLTFGLGL